MPSFEFSEGAYVAFVPLLYWLYTRPRFKEVLIIGFLSGWISWCALLIWLRHVTYFGTFALSAFLGLIFLFWLLAAAWIMPRIERRNFLIRVIGFAGLAGFWVLLEWVRTWIFWGFPWAPLALSQWERPVVLQIASWTGAYGVSFLLIFFGCCIAQTVRFRITAEKRNLLTGLLNPDLYLAVGLLCGCIYVFFQSLPERGKDSQSLLTAGVVQPYILPELKWDETKAEENLDVLEAHTRFVGVLESDVILWPESATPWPIIPFAHVRTRVERLSNELERSILMGNLAWERESDIWYNGAFLVEPMSGLVEDFYVKRKLVPFGEFVPSALRFIEKVVPVGGDFIPGVEAGLLRLNIDDREVGVGPLVCYEDTFPRLARESVRAGADVLYVATNNAWYGEEGGAPQHAAHSVLRAVENRRPVMRVGNAGWSGWIDSYGTIREVITDEEGSIYFRGGGVYSVFQYDEWSQRQSYYTRNGDWFVVLCAFLVALSWVSLKLFKHPRPE